MSIWNDPVFAGTKGSNPILAALETAPNVKQSVSKVELTDDQLKFYDRQPPKFSSWNGFWADPVFTDVEGRRVPVPEGEKRDFWKYEVDDSVSISSLFPSLSSSAFGSVSFRKSAIEWWSKPIRDQPAGLYLRTEIEFNGLLNEVFRVFKEFLGEAAKPTLRLSAYLGVAQVPDGTYAAQGLTFIGSLLGLRTPMPPVLELVIILSVGVQLNIGRTNTTAEIKSPTAPAKSPNVRCTIFGDLHVIIPGLTGPLLLEYKAIISDAFLRLDMTIPGDGKWRNPLGVESLLLDEAKFLVNIPLPKTAKPGETSSRSTAKSPVSALAHTPGSQQRTFSSPSGPTAVELDASFFFTVTAKWKTSSSGTVSLKGVVYKQYPDASYLEGTLEKVTWSDIKKFFSDIHGQDLQPSEHEITCERLTVRISKAHLLLTGALTVNGRHLAAATIAITSAGIAVRADLNEWVIDDGYVTINDASLTLMIGSATSAPSAGPKDKQTSKASQKSWYGGLEVAGHITIREGLSKPIDIQVALVAGKQGREWFWAICGSMKSDISLRSIVSAIDEGSDLDLRLKSVSLVASSMNEPKCNLGSKGYPVKQGIYLWATLEKLPFVRTGGAVKEPAEGDSTQFAIGWQKGSKVPNISIFLPQSLKIDLGPRFRSDRFELQVGGLLSLRFVGGFQVRMDDESDWLRFQLAAKVDPKEVTGELIFEGNINNPFGLSKQITIGPKLAIGLAFNWVQLATTGLPMGAGFLGSFYIGEINPANAYEMALYLCENPKDMLIMVNAPSMDYFKLVKFATAVMDKNIPTMDMKVLEFKDVLIYASLGVSFAGDYYPPGFRFRGRIIVFDHEAGMDCSLTIEGFHLKAWLQSFELGPLKIGGNVLLPDKPGLTFAVLEMEINLHTQKFFLSGYIEIFSLRASIDLHMQLLPAPIFYFDLQLQWSDLLKINAQAMMINKTEEKSLTKKLANADWTINVQIEQRIIQEMVQTLQEALRAFHEAAQAKIDKAQQSVAEAEARFKAGIEAAQKDLNAKRLVYEQKNDALDAQIEALTRATTAKKATLQQGVSDAKLKETSKVQDARLARDKKLDEKKNDVKAKEYKLQNEEADGRNKENDALSERERKKQAFMAEFGNAEDSIRQARYDVNREKDSVNSIKGDMDNLIWQRDNLSWRNFWRAPDLSIQIAAHGVALGVATAVLAVAECALTIAQAVMESELFKYLKGAWYQASETFISVQNMVSNAVQTARKALDLAKEAVSAAELALAGDFEAAQREAKAMVNNAQNLYNQYAENQRLEAEKLNLQLQMLKNSIESTALAAAESALEVAKLNNIAFKAAQAGLEAVKSIEGTIYVTLNAIIEAAGSLCDIRVAKLNGRLTAKKEDQKPFKIYLEGTVLANDFTLNLDYTPGETGAFLKSMASSAIKELK